MLLANVNVYPIIVFCRWMCAGVGQLSVWFGEITTVRLACTSFDAFVTGAVAGTHWQGMPASCAALMRAWNALSCDGLP